MNVNLEYYRIFYHVAKAGSFTQAGEELCISQPAVSQAIKLLESSLGSKLFIRVPKGVRLTPEGEVLFSYIQRGYEYILLGEAKFQKMLDLENGEIRIGASDMTLQYFLLPYLEKFHQRFPKIKVTVTNAPTPDTLEYLYEEKIDFGIVSEPFEAKPDIEVVKVKEIQDTFVAGSRFDYLKDRVLSFKELEELPIICLEHNTSSRKFIDEFLEDNDVVMKPEFELAMSDIIVKFASRNLGIGCVVRDFALEALNTGKLFELRFEQELPRRHFCIITGNNNPISKAAKELLRIIHSKDLN
ncbi:LysR family transcriptional regulator [Lachnospiraceae bacterium MD1]|jgi:DNA-binding transcriptional LysR family regulator|uniref:LysR family transcriptional regulator n=1 Tax=Variimorphobacter saccharofermentans TaxID=2755051 RepID=A0A839JXQ3_9FIRM|nr:LysR family transcriptional regulator [Variimorphobacter saccharofermentans]MBB2182084.1 LysR family transcriptional regulator [Variimorphobacter saccharofermentans]